MHLQRLKKHGDVGGAKPLLSRHGLKHTITYSSWVSMRSRCKLSNAKAFPHYTGVTVCSRWSSFENFLKDMGERPGIEYTLDRIDNSKGYSPSNCRWATKTQQCINRKVFSNNTSGVRGVYWLSDKSRWQAILHVNKVKYYSPTFVEKADAVAYRKKLESEFGF